MVCTKSQVSWSLPLLQGVARFYQAKKRHVITTQTEHKCVLDSCRILEAEGFNITYLPVQKSGILDLEVLSHYTQNMYKGHRHYSTCI